MLLLPRAFLLSVNLQFADFYTLNPFVIVALVVECFGVTTICEGAFRECKSLRAIELPDSVQDINRMMVSRCTSLESIRLSSALTSIGEYTFSGCKSLHTVELPSALKKIIHNAFQGCSSLTEIRIPENVEEIWFEAFLNCSSLKTMRMPVSLRSFGRGVLQGCDTLETIELYGKLSKDKPIPEWLETLVSDKCSTCEIILEGRRITSINKD